MVRIAHARSSETGGAWGRPGDQLQASESDEWEVEKRDWWNGNWKACYRADNNEDREVIAHTAEAAAENVHVGYSQNNGASPRTTLFDFAKACGWDVSKIDKDCNTDCSALIAVCCNAAGIPISKDVYTGNLDAALMDSGHFYKVTGDEVLKRTDKLHRGDILLKEGHVVVVIDDGISSDEGRPAIIRNCAHCHIRRGPSKSYRSLGILDAGMIVTVYDKAVSGIKPIQGWKNVKSGSTNGYTSSLYVEDMAATVTTGNVHMRKSASLTAKSIKVLMKGTHVFLTGNTKKSVGRTWFECYESGDRGWVSGKYLR